MAVGEKTNRAARDCQSTKTRFDARVYSLWRTKNSQAILVKENGKVVFEKAYGFADRERKVPKTLETRFHVASLSMQFSAAAVLRLVDEGQPVRKSRSAIVRSLPIETFHRSDPPPSVAELENCTGNFEFGASFYQPNAQLAVIVKRQALSLRWSGGSVSPLIPVGKDHFVDRCYWEQVKMDRDAAGKPTGLAYGSFHGSAAPDP